MANLIKCDGGCGKISPAPQTRLHIANGWLTVKARTQYAPTYIDRKGVYCDDCAPRVLVAMDGSDEPPPAPIVTRPFITTAGIFWLFSLGVAGLVIAKALGA